MFITRDAVIHTVSGENGPPQLIWHSFTNSQRFWWRGNLFSCRLNRLKLFKIGLEPAVRFPCQQQWIDAPEAMEVCVSKTDPDGGLCLKNGPVRYIDITRSVFKILRLTSTSENSCFHSGVPAEAVTLTNNYLSFSCLCCLINRKVKVF